MYAGEGNCYFSRGQSFSMKDSEMVSMADVRPKREKFSEIKLLGRFLLNGETHIKVSDHYAVPGTASSFRSPGIDFEVEPAP